MAYVLSGTDDEAVFVGASPMQGTDFIVPGAAAALGAYLLTRKSGAAKLAGAAAALIGAVVLIKDIRAHGVGGVAPPATTTTALPAAATTAPGVVATTPAEEVVT